MAAASVVAALPAKSTTKPVAMSTLSGVFVLPNPSWANPVVPSNAVALVAVNVAVRVVELVTIADVKSEAANVTPTLSELASRSHTNLDQSRLDFTSVLMAARFPPNLVPVNTNSVAPVPAFLP